jgi:hypothetical protein
MEVKGFSKAQGPNHTRREAGPERGVEPKTRADEQEPDMRAYGDGRAKANDCEAHIHVGGETAPYPDCLSNARSGVIAPGTHQGRRTGRHLVFLRTGSRYLLLAVIELPRSIRIARQSARQPVEYPQALCRLIVRLP